jgi:hypothetical protein
MVWKEHSTFPAAAQAGGEALLARDGADRCAIALALSESCIYILSWSACAGGQGSRRKAA